MSATPRPWKPLNTSDDDMLDAGLMACVYGPDGSVGYVRSGEDAELVCRAVNAFDALLAVAKACGDDWEREEKALAALDAAHPDWRTWAKE
ncbi:MAG TPA: hypothetical protein VN524_06140 [Hyphomicrobiaceae bacterium]|nr:hypothetical protein [Hyphomicrobiaceae bacterium]